MFFSKISLYFALLLSAVYSFATSLDASQIKTSADSSTKFSQDFVAALSLQDSSSREEAFREKTPREMSREEFLSPDIFQNRVIRLEQMQKKMRDASQDAMTKKFAFAAALFYADKQDSAIAAYEALLGKDKSLDPMIILRLAKIFLAKQDFDSMRKILRSSDSLLTTDSWENTALFLRAEAALADTLLSDKNKTDSLAAYLNRFPKGERATFIRFRYAVLLEKLGDNRRAKKAYLRVLAAGGANADSAFAGVHRLRKADNKEETLDEKWAYTKLACANVPSEECLSLIDSILALDLSIATANQQQNVDSAEVLLSAEDSVWAKLPPSTLERNVRKSIWEKRAVALRGAGKFEESYAQFRFLIDSVESKALWMQSALKLLRKDETKNAKAIAELDSLLQSKNQFGKENANNLWLRGFESEQKKKYKQAIRYYEQLENPKFGKNNRRQWATFRIGLVYVKQGNWAAAKKKFEEGKKLPFTWSASASRMFLGDAEHALGHDSLAKMAYLDCIEDFPLGYYAHRCRAKLGEYKLLPVDSIPVVRGVDMSEKETFAWIRKRQSKMRHSYSAENFARVQTLLNYGFAEEALQLFQSEFKTNKNSKRLDFLYAYGTLFFEYGETALAYRLARAFQNAMPRAALARAPRSVLQFLYPIPYNAQVVRYAGHSIDPYFVYSVMRQESIFDFKITSPVGARGLLQIMPATGKNLASLEQISPWNPDMLYNPYMNIRLGVRYLIDLKHEYNEDYMYVLGNYNAGPKPTKRWQAAGKDLPWDIRAEDISYWETRDYVKRVMGNYWIYKEIRQGVL